MNRDGLPDEVGKSIPDSEEILWYGKPNWKSFGYQAFGVKYLLFYFFITAFYAVSQTNPAFSFGAFLTQYVPFLISGFFAGLILFLLSYIAARHTCYVITEKRIVIRTGVALVFLLNVPFKNILSIDKKILSKGIGDLCFQAQSKKRIPYLSCWPSLRSTSFLEPIPAFRSISDVEEIGNLVGEIAKQNREQKPINVKSVRPGVAA